MRVRILAMGAVLLAAGCQAATERYGSGPIALTSGTQAAFDRYKNRLGPLYFAVSADGRRSFSVYCREVTCQPGDYMREALAGCRTLNEGRPCHIYAVGGTVVWDAAGPPRDAPAAPAVERHGQRQAPPIIRP